MSASRHSESLLAKISTVQISRRRFLHLSALGAAGLAAGCMPSTPSPKPAADAKGRVGGTLTVALPSEPLAMDTAQVSETNGRRLMFQLYDGLLDESPDGSKYVPALAESWESSRDGLVHTFKIRRNVQFHDGTPLDAKAVKFSFDRQLDKDHPFFGMAASWTYPRSFLRQVTAMEVVDDFTLRIVQKQPDASLFPALQITTGRIVGPAAIQKYGKAFVENPVGTGPFRLATWEKGVRVVMERNPSYFGGAPALDKLIFVPISDAQARMTALRTGQVDLIAEIPPDSLALLESDPNLALWKGTTRHFWALVLNEKNVAAFRDKRVRQAIAHAINKEALVREVLRGTATVAVGPLSDGFAAYKNANVKTYPYDPQKARQLLADSGVSGLEVKFTIPSGGAGFLAPQTMAQFIQANLAAVGIRSEIQTKEITAFNRDGLNGNFEMQPHALSTALGTPDSMFLTYFYGERQPPNGLNIGFWKNEEFDKTIDAAAKSADEAHRKQLINRAQEIIAEEVPWVFICHEQGIYAMKKTVKGFQQWANYTMAFKNVTLG